MVSTEIMKSLNLSIEQLQRYLAYLGDVFGARLQHIIPDRISDLPTLQWIIRLSESLKKLEGFEGFESHINTYTRRQVRSSYFVTVVAGYLSDKGVDDIVFDPPVTVTGRKSRYAPALAPRTRKAIPLKRVSGVSSYSFANMSRIRLASSLSSIFTIIAQENGLGDRRNVEPEYTTAC